MCARYHASCGFVGIILCTIIVSYKVFSNYTSNICRAQLPLLVLELIVLQWSRMTFGSRRLNYLLTSSIAYHSPSNFCWWLLPLCWWVSWSSYLFILTTMTFFQVVPCKLDVTLNHWTEVYWISFEFLLCAVVVSLSQLLLLSVNRAHNCYILS